MTRALSKPRLGVRLTPTFLIGAGLVAAATAGFELLTGTRFVGATTAGGFVELLMLAVPAVGLVYAGYWLETGEYDPDDVWRIGLFAVGGVLVAAAATLGLLLLASVPVLDATGTFVLFVGTSTEGGLLGVLAGTFATTESLFRREQNVADEFEILHALLRHDLRNRLTIIGGNLTQLAEDASVDHDRVRTIRAQLDAVDGLLQDTGLVSEALRGDSAHEPVDLAAVVRHQASLLTESYDDAAVETDLPASAFVLADDLLGPVIDNVLSNAVIHNDQSTPEIEVTVAATDDRVVVAVADNGPGIPPGRREEAFDPGVGHGTGMGLYLVSTIVEGYGGTVELADNEPRGTVVRLMLPRAAS